jgi:hypothetical protein
MGRVKTPGGGESKAAKRPARPAGLIGPRMAAANTASAVIANGRVAGVDCDQARKTAEVLGAIKGGTRAAPFTSGKRKGCVHNLPLPSQSCLANLVPTRPQT